MDKIKKSLFEDVMQIEMLVDLPKQGKTINFMRCQPYDYGHKITPGILLNSS